MMSHLHLALPMPVGLRRILRNHYLVPPAQLHSSIISGDMERVQNQKLGLLISQTHNVADTFRPTCSPRYQLTKFQLLSWISLRDMEASQNEKKLLICPDSPSRQFLYRAL